MKLHIVISMPTSTVEDIYIDRWSIFRGSYSERTGEKETIFTGHAVFEKTYSDGYMSDAALVSLTMITLPCRRNGMNCCAYGHTVIDVANRIATFSAEHAIDGDWLVLKRTYLNDGWSLKFRPYRGFEHYKLS